MKKFLIIVFCTSLFIFSLTSCTLSTSNSSSSKSNIFGSYEGKSNLVINRENYLAQGLDNISGSGAVYDANYKAAQESNKISLAGVDFKIKNGSNERILILNPNGSYKSVYDATGVNYIVWSNSETSFLPKNLTPLLNKETEVITLSTTDKGFKSVITNESTVYTLECTFQGKDLSGSWKLISGGKELMKSDFVLKLAIEMPNQ